jgi:hypothetical protein
VPHSKPLEAWLAEHKHEIEVFYLPSYSHEINPIDMTNADQKQALTKVAPARSKPQPVKATTGIYVGFSGSPSGSRANSSKGRFELRLEFNSSMPDQ